MSGDSFEAVMQERHPEIPWRTPVPVTVERITRWCCRYCIARFGLKGSQVEYVGFASVGDCQLHILREHGER